jgi:hypothetical protein
METVDAERVFRAYRSGLLRRSGPETGRNLSFQVLISLVSRDLFPVRERVRFRRIWNASWHGLSAARAGHLEEAMRLFAIGEEELAAVEMGSGCWLLGLSILESARAYLDYREGRFELARERTYAAMDADSTLEQRGAYGLLELHRVQAVHNLMRIDLRAGEASRAFSLAGDILIYLEGHRESLPVHRDWRKRWLQQAPHALRRKLIAQVADEVALALVANVESNGWETFSARISSWMCQAKVGLHPRVFLWIQVKAARVAGDASGYLDRLCDFLSGGREDIPALWYSCMIDFLEFCDVENSSQSRYVKAAVLRDTAKWPALPETFRSCLDRYSDGVAWRSHPGSG